MKKNNTNNNKRVFGLPRLSVVNKEGEEIVKKKETKMKGRSGNPKGRPLGKRNKTTETATSLILRYLESDSLDKYDSLFANIDSVKSATTRAKLKIELYKLVTPKPKSEDEKINERKIANALHNKYFNKRSEDDED